MALLFGLALASNLAAFVGLVSMNMMYRSGIHGRLRSDSEHDVFACGFQSIRFVAASAAHGRPQKASLSVAPGVFRFECETVGQRHDDPPAVVAHPVRHHHTMATLIQIIADAEALLAQSSSSVS
jgi:hypothetical protein